MASKLAPPSGGNPAQRPPHNVETEKWAKEVVTTIRQRTKSRKNILFQIYF